MSSAAGTRGRRAVRATGQWRNSSSDHRCRSAARPSGRRAGPSRSMLNRLLARAVHEAGPAFMLSPWGVAMGRGRGLVLVALGLILLGSLSLRHWRNKDRGSVHRGFQVAERSGCFACHGPGGYRGMANPGHGLEDVPPWSGGLITMYADNEAEIREWIEDGMPKRLRADPEQVKLRKGAAIAMPAFRGSVAENDLRALVAYVKAVSD